MVFSIRNLNITGYFDGNITSSGFSSFRLIILFCVLRKYTSLLFSCISVSELPVYKFLKEDFEMKINVIKHYKKIKLEIFTSTFGFPKENYANLQIR